MNPFNRAPMNLQQIQDLRQRVDRMDAQAANATMPTDWASGLAYIGDAFARGFARNRLNSQFPSAPPAPSFPAAPPAPMASQPLPAPAPAPAAASPGLALPQTAPLPTPAPATAALLPDDNQRNIDPHAFSGAVPETGDGLLRPSGDPVSDALARDVIQKSARGRGGLW